MNAIKGQARQGDIFISRRREPIPTTAKEQPRIGGRVVLARGAVTTHEHAFPSPSAKLLADDSGTYLSLAESSELVHEEHGTILFEAGDWDVTRQLEERDSQITQVED